MVPGMQPLGPVKVDWSNCLTRNLVLCLEFNSLNPVDLASGFPIITGNRTGWSMGTTPYGRAIQASGGQNDGSMQIADNDSKFSTNTFTWQVEFYTNSTGSQCLVDQWEGAGSSLAWVCEIDTVMYVGSALTPLWERVYSGGSVSTTNVNRFIYSCDRNAGTQTLYQDYVPQSLTSVWVGGGAYTNPQNSSLPIKIGANSDGKKLNGKLCRFRFWNRTLDALECIELQRNPNQFLIPA